MVREAARNVNRALVETIAPLRPLDPIALGSAAAILCLFPFAEPPGPTRSPSCDRLGSSSSQAFFGNDPGRLQRHCKSWYPAGSATSASSFFRKEARLNEMSAWPIDKSTAR